MRLAPYPYSPADIAALLAQSGLAGQPGERLADVVIQQPGARAGHQQRLAARRAGNRWSRQTGGSAAVPARSASQACIVVTVPGVSGVIWSLRIAGGGTQAVAAGAQRAGFAGGGSLARDGPGRAGHQG